MQRRSFIVGTTVAILGLAGCAADGGGSPAKTPTQTNPPTEKPTDTPSTPEREPPSCVDPERPEPEEGSGNVEPATYPEKPPSLENDQEMAEYIVAYEEAYRTNDLIEIHGSDLHRVQLGIGEPQFFDSPSNSTIGRVEYTYGYEFGSSVVDSPTTYVSYYVDESVVARAEHEGMLDDESNLKPNPLAGGNVLQCFE